MRVPFHWVTEIISLITWRMHSSAIAPIFRTLGVGTFVALGGLLLSLGILRATNVFRMIPSDGAQIWVRSGCAAAEAAVRAALRATQDKPVFLVPLDQDSELMRKSCRSTLVVLGQEGYWWLQYFPERWLCHRLAIDAGHHFDSPIPVPRFYTGGRIICDGLCEGAFEHLGRPELQQFVFFVKPVENQAQ